MKSTSKQIRKYGTVLKKQSLRINKKNQIFSIRTLLEECKFSLAKSNIDNYIEEYGYDCYIIHEYGKYYEKQNSLESARSYFNINIENKSENMYYSLYELAKIEKEFGNYNKAINYLIEIINSKHPDKSHAMLELAKVYIVLEKYEEAELKIKEILDSSANNTLKEGAYQLLIQIKINNLNLKEAEQLLEKFKDKTSDSKIKFLFGQLENKKGNKLKAYQIFNDILKNDTECKLKASYELVILEIEINHLDRAFELLNSILERKNFHYNEALETKINCLIKMGNFKSAYECIDELLNINGNKSITNFYMAKMEIYNKNYYRALSLFENVTKENLRIYRNMLYKKTCILIKQERYEEAYATFNSLKEYDYNRNYENKYNLLEIYLKDKLNQSCDIEPKIYVENLLCEYNYERVIEHIKKHKEEDNNKINHTIFNPNIDIENLYNYVLDNLNEDNFIINSFNDVYILEYPNIGSDGEKILNYLKVITLPNSKKIVTMYPFDRYLNNNYSKTENSKSKKLSRIDKFNKKYGVT